MERRKRAAIYARVSTDEQTSENQLFELRKFAKLKGWRVAEEFVDHAISGGRADRAEFRRLLEQANRRKFDIVVFWSLDRFSREGVRPTLEYLHRLREWGVEWKSLTEQYIDSAGPFAEAIIALMATFARLERVKISDRTKTSLARLKSEGKKLGRPKLEEQRRRVHELRGSLSVRKIAEEVGISKASVERFLKERPPEPKPVTAKVVAFRKKAGPGGGK
jgi:DNA invertase Pin-like site-specific DNA recombinase